MAVSKGIQTTEFALTLVVNIASIIGSVSGIIPASWALIAMTVINSIYGVLRTIVKINDPAYNVPDLPTVTLSTSSGAATTTVTK